MMVNIIKKTKEISVLLRSIFVLLVLSATHASYADKGVSISQIDLKYSLFQPMAKEVLEKAYSKIGMSLEYEGYPAARSLVIANSGVTDGELARVSGLQKIFPDLIMISVPIAYDEVFVYSKNHDFKVEGWKSLQPYKLDFIKGFKMAEKKTKGMNVEMVGTTEQGLGKISMNRSDLFIGLAGVECFINELKIPGIKRLSPRLDKIGMFHYLHKRHSDLAEKLKKVLSEMEESGEIALIQEQSKQDFVNQCKLQ